MNDDNFVLLMMLVGMFLAILIGVKNGKRK